MRHDRLLIGITIIAVVLIFALVIWVKIDEAKHCTKWGTHKAQITTCTWTSNKTCLQYETHEEDQSYCMERDDRK